MHLQSLSPIMAPGIRYFNQKLTLLKMLQILHAVLFWYVKQCPVVFGFSNLCAFFAYVIS